MTIFSRTGLDQVYRGPGVGVDELGEVGFGEVEVLEGVGLDAGEGDGGAAELAVR